jgi:hypothetical protein
VQILDHCASIDGVVIDILRSEKPVDGVLNLIQEFHVRFGLECLTTPFLQSTNHVRNRIVPLRTNDNGKRPHNLVR